MKYSTSLVIVGLLMTSCEALTMRTVENRHVKLGCCPSHLCSASCDCACAFGGGVHGDDSAKAIARVEVMVDHLKA